MSRTDVIRRVASLLLVISLLLPVAGAEAAEQSFRPDDEDLYFGALEEELIDTTRTTEVYKGTFSVNSAFKGSINYSGTEYLFNTIDTGEVRFDQYMAREGDYVRKGDPIVRVKVSLSGVNLSELEENIRVATEKLESYVIVNEGLLSEYLYQMEHASDKDDRRLAELLYKRLSVNFAEERARREQELEKLCNQYSTYSMVQDVQYLTAPTNGVIDYLNFMYQGDRMDYYAFVGIFRNMEDLSIAVRDGSSLRYGQEVTISQIQGTTEVTYRGRVVSSKSELLPSNMIGTTDLIEFIDSPNGLVAGRDITVRAQSVRMENAILVARSAVSTDAKGSYVFLYRDGHRIKKYVVLGGSNGSEAWIVSGLNEGDRVVIK